MSLPMFFLALSGAALLAALLALWGSFRAAFGGGGELLLEDGGLPEQSALSEEKNALLRSINDLRYEKELGKISEEDFARLDREYRERARQLFAEIDAGLGPARDEAELLIDEHLRKLATPARRKGKRGAAPTPPDAAEETASPLEVEPAGPALAAEPPRTDSSDASEADSSDKSEVSLDALLVEIREGRLKEVPDPPAHWPVEARRFFADSLRRALDELARRETPPSADGTKEDP